jgi:hypothetical protein
MVCVATGHKVCSATDNDGNTPEMLARNANYVGWEDVARQIRTFGTKFQQQYKPGDNVPRTPTNQGLDLNFGGGSSSSTAGGGGGGSSSSSSIKKRRDLFVQTNANDGYSSIGGVRNMHHRNKSDQSYSHNNNENNLNLWNTNENRQVMDKLGISPSHKYGGISGGVEQIQSTVEASNWKDYSSRYSPTGNAAPVAATVTTTVTDSRRSISTPRNFGSSGMSSSDNYNTNILRNSIPTLTNENVTSTTLYTSIYHPQKSYQNNNNHSSSSSSSASSYTSGLPPKSPRYSDKSPRYTSSLSTTPKNSGGGGSYQYPENPAVHQQQQESSRGRQLDNREANVTRQRSSSVGVLERERGIRSPVSIMQDKRLSELREQLSSMYPVGGGGGGNNSSSNNNNATMTRSPSVPSVRFLEDEPPRDEPSLLPSIRTDHHYGSMQDSSQSRYTAYTAITSIQ